jgi:prepilin-type N-terminal cleavage/methylation domain-containing protein
MIEEKQHNSHNRNYYNKLRYCRDFYYSPGFTLLEMMISILVLAFVLMGTFTMFYQGFKHLKKSKDMTVVIELAREVMEVYYDWDQLDVLDGSDDDAVVNGSYALSAITLNNVTYNRNITVNDIASCIPAPAPCPVSGLLKRLTVTISWGSDSFVLESYKAYY